LLFEALSVFVTVFSLELVDYKKYKFLSVFLPAAPAAWAATSGPASGRSPGVGHPHSSLLASSRVVAAPPSALLALQVGVSALLAGSLPDSHKGGGTGFGVGGGAG
jgi:hypothetical protein